MNEHEPSSVEPKPSASSRYGFAPPEALLWGMYLGVVFTALASLVLTNGQIATWEYWDADQNKSEVLRNLGLVALGVVGLPLAIWRSMTAFRQSETANRQADLAEKGLIIDRFQKGAQMLESDDLSVRLAGVYALRELAQSDPNETYIMVQDLLFDFIRERSKTRKRVNDPIPFRKIFPWATMRSTLNEEEFEAFPQDLQIALTNVCWLRDHIPASRFLEQSTDWVPNLSNSNLFGAFLEDMNLSGVNLEGANLSKAKAQKANLSNANLSFTRAIQTVFIEADLSASRIVAANFEKGRLMKASLAGAEIKFTNLKQANMRNAILCSATLISCNLRRARCIDVDCTAANFTKTNLTDSIFSVVNLTDASISFLNVTRTHIDRIRFQNTSVSNVWADRDWAPTSMPMQLTEIIVFRDPGEGWNDFTTRIRSGRPELGW